MSDWACDQCAEMDEATYGDGEVFEHDDLTCEKCGKPVTRLTIPKDEEDNRAGDWSEMYVE